MKGPDSPLHPLVAAACLKFYYSSTLLDRALQQDDAFLLLLCPEGGWLGHCLSSYKAVCMPVLQSISTRWPALKVVTCLGADERASPFPCHAQASP